MTFAEPSLQPGSSPRAAPLSTVGKVIIGLEAFLAVGALAGGAILFCSPDGSAFGMPPALLEHSGFTTFLISPRLIERVYGLLANAPRWLMAPAARVGHGVMQARQLRGIKQRAEAANREQSVPDRFPTTTHPRAE
jgi:hypothetical protein